MNLPSLMKIYSMVYEETSRKGIYTYSMKYSCVYVHVQIKFVCKLPKNFFRSQKIAGVLLYVFNKHIYEV